MLHRFAVLQQAVVLVALGWSLKATGLFAASDAEVCADDAPLWARTRAITTHIQWRVASSY